ncbi:MAG: SDR family oxidoreductase [Deltaproteobacteria bacterium]|nr:SDR family oxidoreductase [Deltaproteobacteria bacterium]
MDLGLNGKVAIITGGSEGIGKAVALCLAREGVKAAICARRPDVLEHAAAEIRSISGGEVFAHPVDVTKRKEIAEFVTLTANRFGRIDILVNNAGRSAAKKFEDISDEEWEEDLDLKLMAAIWCSRLVIPHLRKVGGGRIINVTHPGGKAPTARSLPTSVSRAAGIAFTKALSRDYAAENILVNTVCLTNIKSAQTERFWRARGSQGTLEEFHAQMGNNVPLKRLGEPEEVGALVAFLVSEQARFITGTAINIDGGMSAVV